MNKIIVSSFGFVALLLSAIKSIWDIDVCLGSALAGGNVVIYGGTTPLLDFYHLALIRLLLSIFIMFSITLYLIIKRFYHE